MANIKQEIKKAVNKLDDAQGDCERSSFFIADAMKEAWKLSFTNPVYSQVREDLSASMIRVLELKTQLKAEQDRLEAINNQLP